MKKLEVQGRICPKCKTNWIDLENGRYKRMPTYCRNCKQQYNESPERKEILKKARDAWRSRPGLQRHSSLKSRAKREGIPFDLTIEDCIAPSYCPVLGIPLIERGGSQTDNSPSMDRIDPKGGYTKENTILISGLANRIKTNATVEQIQAVAKFYKNLAESFIPA